MRVDWSPWYVDEAGRIAKRYTFFGATEEGGETVLTLLCKVHQPADLKVGRGIALPMMEQRHIFFLISPAIVANDGYLVAEFATMDGEQTTKFLTLRVEKTGDNANLFAFPDSETADKVFSFLMKGLDLRLTVIDSKEVIAKLPLPNDIAFRAIYEQLTKWGGPIAKKEISHPKSTNHKATGGFDRKWSIRSLFLILLVVAGLALLAKGGRAIHLIDVAQKHSPEGRLNSIPHAKPYQAGDFDDIKMQAMAGSSVAQYKLAKMYELGDGVAADIEQAYVWYSVAIMNGNQDAVYPRYAVASKLSEFALGEAKAEAQRIYEGHVHRR